MVKVEKENQIQLISSTPARLARLPQADGHGGSNGLQGSWRIIRKRRWSAISTTIAVVVLVLLWTLRQKPVYQAKGLLEIERENPSIMTVQELFQIENLSDDYVETQYKILQSDSLARDVIRQLHLDQLKEFSSESRLVSWPALFHRATTQENTVSADAVHEQRVLQNFEDRLTVAPIQRSRLVRVTFDSQDPQLAARVVNALAGSYIDESLQTRWDAGQKASAWLGDQLDKLKIKLEKSEGDLQTYASSNGLLYLVNDKGETENIVDQRLRQTQAELTQAQADRYQKESLFRLAEAGDYGALPGVFDNKVTQDLMDRLAELERQQAALTPEFKPDYPKMKEIQSQIDRVQQFLQQHRQQAERHIADEYFAAVHREGLVTKAFDKEQKEASVIAQKSVEYNILKREADTNKQLYEGLLQRMKEAGVSAALRASNIRVVDPAVPPTSPTRPRVGLNLAFGLLFGLAGGAGLAFAQERIDNTFKSPEDVERFLRMFVLAMIPLEDAGVSWKNGGGRLGAKPKGLAASTRRVLSARKDGDGWLRIDTVKQSKLREAFRVLRTSVLLSSPGRPPRSVAFVSAEGGEGKTTVCCNLAVSLAGLGKRILVINADIRRPSVQSFFQLSGSSGLVNYLAGEGEWRSFVQVSNTKGVDCLICGPEPPNPSELLLSERMESLIKDAMNDYNFVLVDSAPLLNVTDGRIVAAAVEGTVLVVKASTTSREHVQRAQACVADVGGHVIGVALNGMDLRKAGYSYVSHVEERHRVANGRGA